MKSILKVKKIKTKLIALLLLLIAFAGITISSIFIRHFYITTKQNIASDLQTISDNGDCIGNSFPYAGITRSKSAS